jgi:nicotinamidase-related amidase
MGHESERDVNIPAIDPRASAVVAIDMHRGHLDPEIDTMPLPVERMPGLIARAAALFDALRAAAVPIIHVVTEYRRAEEIAANPFWKAIADNPTKARRNAMRHNLQGSRGTEIIPALLGPQDIVVRDKKRYSPFHGTNLEFVLRSSLGARTLILAGINTSSCVLNCAFDSTNRDFRVVIAKDAVDSMDGVEMHEFALRLMAATCGWPLSNQEILSALLERR